MERNLLDTPYEILLEIFRRLPKDKLIEVSRLCLKLRGIADDTRLWKDVYIKYEGPKDAKYGLFAFEELYSKPWPVKALDLSGAQIEPPVHSEITQTTKVKTLNLRNTIASKATMDALLARYQCTELNLDFHRSHLGLRASGHLMEISPEAFLKQTALEVLSVERFILSVRRLDRDDNIEKNLVTELAPILSNCKNLKVLYLRSLSSLTNSDLLNIVESLPTSLEKLFLGQAYPENRFFELLAKTTSNLKEIELFYRGVKLPSLLNFQFLEVLHVITFYVNRPYSDLLEYLIKFPALKTVHIIVSNKVECSSGTFGKLRMSLEPHGIIVRSRTYLEPIPIPIPNDGNFWKVSKTM